MQSRKSLYSDQKRCLAALASRLAVPLATVAPVSESAAAAAAAAAAEFRVVNFYHLVDVSNPEQVKPLPGLCLSRPHVNMQITRVHPADRMQTSSFTQRLTSMLEICVADLLYIAVLIFALHFYPQMCTTCALESFPAHLAAYCLPKGNAVSSCVPWAARVYSRKNLLANNRSMYSCIGCSSTAPSCQFSIFIFIFYKMASHASALLLPAYHPILSSNFARTHCNGQANGKVRMIRVLIVHNTCAHMARSPSRAGGQRTSAKTSWQGRARPHLHLKSGHQCTAEWPCRGCRVICNLG